MKIYLQKKYDYRQWPVLFGGIGASLFGAIPLLFAIASAMKTDWNKFSWWYIPAIIFSFGIPSMLLSSGIWLIHSWLIKRVNILEISDIGVKYGSRLHSWEQIKWISCRSFQKSGTLTLFYQKKGFSFDYNLVISDSLSAVEVDELFDALEKDIIPCHRKLQIG